MSAYRVLDKLDSVIRTGAWLPFGWRAVNADRALDLLEKLRSSLPDEAARAKRSEPDDRSLAGSSPGAGPSGLLSEAQTKASESDVVTKAQARAAEIIEQAQNAARDIRRGADDYADGVLASLDASLGRALAAVQKGRQTLASSNGRKPREMSAT